MNSDWIYVNESLALAREAYAAAMAAEFSAPAAPHLARCIDELTQLCGGLVRVVRAQADAIARLEAAGAPVIADSDDIPAFLRGRPS